MRCACHSVGVGLCRSQTQLSEFSAIPPVAVYLSDSQLLPVHALVVPAFIPLPIEMLHCAVPTPAIGSWLPIARVEGGGCSSVISSYPYLVFRLSTRATYCVSASVGVTPSSTTFCQALFLALPWSWGNVSRVTTS